MASATGERRHRGIVAVSVMLATIMQALDTTIANVALPYMQGSLSATQDQINWVLTSYIVAAAIMTPPTGWLADRFGRKRLLLIAITGFVGASMLCGIAASIGQMVLFRLLQGVCGAPLVPLAQSVLLDLVPRERYGRVMALWGIGVMVGPILGPTLGGYLTENYDWRWVFYINLPIGGLAFLGLLTALRERCCLDQRRFAWFGFGALAVAVAALQLMLDRGQRLDWFGSTEILAEAAIAALGLYLFLSHMATARRPFLPRALFSDRNFVTATGFIFVIGLVLLANLALLAPFLQTLLGYPVLTAGLAMSPRGFGTIAAMLIVGRVIGRVDPRWLILFGLGVTAFSLHAMTGFSLEVPMRTIVWTGIVQGFGLGFVFVPLSATAFVTLPAALRTDGTALYSLMRNLGSSVGISVVIALLARNEQIVRAGLVEHVTPFSAAVAPLSALPQLDPVRPRGKAVIDAEVDRQAALVAYLDDFEAMMVVTLAAMPFALIFRGPRRSERKEDEPRGAAAAAS